MLQRLNDVNVNLGDSLVIEVVQPIDGHHVFLFFVEAVHWQSDRRTILRIEGIVFGDHKRFHTLKAEDIVGVQVLAGYSDTFIVGILLNFSHEMTRLKDRLNILEMSSCDSGLADIKW